MFESQSIWKDREFWEVVGAFALAIIALHFWNQMSRAEEVVDVLKYGFQYLGTIILMVRVTRS